MSQAGLVGFNQEIIELGEPDGKTARQKGTPKISRARAKRMTKSKGVCTDTVITSGIDSSTLNVPVIIVWRYIRWRVELIDCAY